MVEALNRRIGQWAQEGAIILVDTARVAASVGLECWEEPGHWHGQRRGSASHGLAGAVGGGRAVVG
jgi:hypothetical protein